MVMPFIAIIFSNCKSAELAVSFKYKSHVASVDCCFQ